MGCNSDYMQANEREINLSIVYGLLDEIKTGKLPKNFGDGYDKRVYDKGLSKEHLDEKTAELCSKLKKLDVSKYSLEMQMWWREHQKADRERKKQKSDELKLKKQKEQALSKLSARERKILGLD